MLRNVEILKVLACLTVVTLAPATAAYADAAGPYDPNNNPNCTHGERDCSANYPTTDLTKKPPSNNSNPNCTSGQQGCTANYPTTDHSEDNPNKTAH